MTTEIEKTFFDTFGIEPKACIASCNKCQHYSYDYCFSGYCTLDSDYDNCGVAEKQYPQITDSILLELTAIHSYWCLPRLCCFNVEQLKKQVLSDLTLFNDERIELIHQVRTLFEEKK